MCIFRTISFFFFFFLNYFYRFRERSRKKSRLSSPLGEKSVYVSCDTVERMVDVNRGSSTMILSNGWATRATRWRSLPSRGIHGVSNRDPPWHVYTGEPIPATRRSWYSILHYPPLFSPRPSFLILASRLGGIRFHRTSWTRYRTFPPFFYRYYFSLFSLLSVEGPLGGKWRMDFDVTLSKGIRFFIRFINK